MPTPNEDHVRRVMNERNRAGVLRLAVSDAWDEVTKKYPDQAWWRRKTTKRGLVWEYAVNNAIAGLADDHGVNIVRHNDTVSLVFDNAILLRIKKADLELRTRNYPTLQALLFHEHDADLFGYSGLQRVEAAYTLNRFETAVDWIGIVAQENSRNLWSFELTTGGATVEAFPTAPATEPTADRVLKPKQPGEAAARKDQ